MYPNTQTPQMYTQYPQQPKKTRGKAILLTLLALAAIAGAAAGVYFWQQQRVDGLNREKDQLNAQLANAGQEQQGESAAPNQFSYPKAPFVFSYPSDWTITSGQPVTFDAVLPAVYQIELLAPSTIRTVTLAGGPDVISKTGARVTISKAATNETDVQKALGTFPGGTAPTFITGSVAGIAAVQYEYAWEGPKYEANALVKDGALYILRFDAEDDANLKSNEHYAVYQSLVSSFTFK